MMNVYNGNQRAHLLFTLAQKQLKNKNRIINVVCKPNRITKVRKTHGVKKKIYNKLTRIEMEKLPMVLQMNTAQHFWLAGSLAPDRRAHLNTAGQHLVEDVRSLLHDAHVLLRGVGALAVLDGVDEAVPELLDRAQQVLLDEVHHAVVWGRAEGGGGVRAMIIIIFFLKHCFFRFMDHISLDKNSN